MRSFIVSAELPHCRDETPPEGVTRRRYVSAMDVIAEAACALSAREIR
jgi:hypothetical protein